MCSSMKKTFCLAVTALLLPAGCNKTDAPAPANTPQSTAAPSTATPTTGMTGAGTVVATPMTEVAGTYNAVSDVSGQPDAKRHQTLILNADGTAELDTKLIKTHTSTTPETSDVGTGDFTAGRSEVIVTFKMKDKKPLTASDTMRVLRMTRDAGGKALTSEDGRTFERAK